MAKAAIAQQLLGAKLMQITEPEMRERVRHFVGRAPERKLWYDQFVISLKWTAYDLAERVEDIINVDLKQRILLPKFFSVREVYFVRRHGVLIWISH